jgi:hypothetical protein
MEQRTKIEAPEGKQYVIITREFNLSVELLYKAYTEAQFIEQWMGTKVLKLENKTTEVMNLKLLITIMWYLKQMVRSTRL